MDLGTEDGEIYEERLLRRRRGGGGGVGWPAGRWGWLGGGRQ